MYPSNITQDFIGKKKYWMAQPYLPTLDIKLTKKIYRKYEKNNTKVEAKRNKKLKVFTFKK